LPPTSIKMVFWYLTSLLVCIFATQAISEKSVQWDPNSYSQLFANNTLMYAYGAYCPSASLVTWSCKWCEYVPSFQVDTVVDLDALQAFTGYDPAQDQVIVSFRGTSNVIDWLDDFDATVMPYPGVPGGLVHKGFYQAWEKLSVQVLPSVQNLISEHSTSQIMVTGHSLGASVAQVASLDIFNYSAQVGGTGYRFVETYGSPRWCNEVMVNYFMQIVDVHWRVVNIHDVVPTVPPEGPNYHHTPTMVWYTSDSPLTYVICDESGEDPSCEYFGDSVYDHLHYMDLYEDCS